MEKLPRRKGARGGSVPTGNGAEKARNLHPTALSPFKGTNYHRKEKKRSERTEGAIRCKDGSFAQTQGRQGRQHPHGKRGGKGTKLAPYGFFFFRRYKLPPREKETLRAQE